jgi:hypothetical protein
VTAQQIAGASALAQAAAALGQSQPGQPGQGQPGQPGQPSPGQPGQPSPGQPGQPGQPSPGQGPPSPSQTPSQTAAQRSANSTNGGISQGGTDQVNQIGESTPLELQPVGEGDSRSTEKGSESDIGDRKFADEAWFAKLPPSLRKAIEARSRKRAPRGYEERLRRYFESVD